MKKIPKVKKPLNKGRRKQESDEEDYYEVECILNHRPKKDGSGDLDFLIKWQGFEREEATWEPAQNLTSRGAQKVLFKYLNHKAEFENDPQCKVWLGNSGSRSVKTIPKSGAIIIDSDDDESSEEKKDSEMKELSSQDDDVVIIDTSSVAPHQASQDSSQMSPEEKQKLFQELQMLANYFEPKDWDMEEWRININNPSFQEVGEPNWKEMITYESQEFSTTSDYSEIEGEILTSQFYGYNERWDPDMIFQRDDWHPGVQPQSNYACLIHALNMFVGGPLFDSPEKFLALYQSRTKMKKVRCPEFPWEKGLSLRNLKKIIYNPTKDEFLTPHNEATATDYDIKLNLKMKCCTSDQVDSWLKPQTRGLIQYVTKPDIDVNTGKIIERQCHSVVVFKRDDVWFLLDSAEKRPINLKVDKEEALEWIKSIHHANIFIFIRDQVPHKLKDAFVKQWLLITSGELVGKRGGDKKSPKSQKKMQKKGDRKRSSKSSGSKHRRKSSQSVSPQKKRKGRMQQLLGNMIDGLSEEIKEEAMRDSTAAARQQRKSPQPLLNPAELLTKKGSEISDQLLVFMKEEQQRVELLLLIKKLPFLPSLQSLRDDYFRTQEFELIDDIYQEAFLSGSDDYLMKIYQQMTDDIAKVCEKKGKKLTELMKEKHIAKERNRLIQLYQRNQYFRMQKLIVRCPFIPHEYFKIYWHGIGFEKIEMLSVWRKEKFPNGFSNDYKIVWTPMERKRFDGLIMKFSVLPDIFLK